MGFLVQVNLVLYLHGVWRHRRLNMGIFDELPLPPEKEVSFTLFFLRFVFMMRLVNFLAVGFLYKLILYCNFS